MIPRLSVKSNVRQLAASLGIERQDLPKRIATALTRTAVEARKELREEMKRVFDRPKPFTLNSVYYEIATAISLTSAVGLKELDIFGRPHYLEPQIFGGVRPLKPFEVRLQRAGLLPAGMYTVPGQGVKLDSYGNISRGQIVQILSQLRTFTEAGFDPHPTQSRRSKANVKRAGRFFVGRPGGGRLPLGVWQRVGLKLQPVLIFVRSPKYAQRFKFHETAERVGRTQFPLQFERAAREASARRAIRLAA